MPDQSPSRPSPFKVGMAGRCPRCGEGALFEGFLQVRPGCTACGLDYSFADSADGPAVFIMLFAGFAILGGALWLDSTYEPPVWVHLAIWLPLSVILCLGLLRPMKGIAIALQYANGAGEGRLDR